MINVSELFGAPFRQRCVKSVAAVAYGAMLLFGTCSPAQASFELFLAKCAICHDDTLHPRKLVFNAAGSAAIIVAVNAAGMNVAGTPDEFTSIANYIDSIKPTINEAPIPHDSAGTAITLGDITVQASEAHASWKIIEQIVTVSPPTKGTVVYQVGAGSSRVIYKPFAGQSGVDTWTYQGVGAKGNTTIRTASVKIAGGATQPVTSYQGLWWTSPAGSESGWGINFAHQGDIIFATWFTYDATGKALWLSMTANKTADGVYAGKFYQTRGPAFSAVPFSPSAISTTEVGTGTLNFGDPSNGTFAYTINGISQTKPITRQIFDTLPACTFGQESGLALATNYQDLWWAAPAGVESGWGVNFTHQGDVIFATWFTYDLDGSPLWLSATARKSSAGVYSGTLYRTTGPAFYAVPFLPANVALSAVGTLTLTFTDGNHATFAYIVNNVTQSKAITRQVFSAPVTICQPG